MNISNKHFDDIAIEMHIISITVHALLLYSIPSKCYSQTLRAPRSFYYTTIEVIHMYLHYIQYANNYFLQQPHQTSNAVVDTMKACFSCMFIILILILIRRIQIKPL